MQPISRRGWLKQATAASAGVLFAGRFLHAATMSAEGTPLTGQAGTEVKMTAVSAHLLRLTISAIGEDLDRYYADGSVALTSFPAPLLAADTATPGYSHETAWGEYRLSLTTNPLRLVLSNKEGRVLQQLTFHPGGAEVEFLLDGPVYGLGPGSYPLDQRGVRDRMQNGAGDNLRVLGARNPIPWLMGNGWGLFFHEPFGAFDLSGKTGRFRPEDSPRGLDLYLVSAREPAQLLRQYAELTGFPHLPAKWTFGFQQSHRTLDNAEQLLQEARTFREKKLPCDTLIYLGTGFCPEGWNTGHGSFVFNQAIFPEPQRQIQQLKDLNFRVVLHVVNPPTNLHGEVADTGVAASEPGDAAEYWAQHVPLIKLGVAGWWPDEGDILPTPSRLVRNRMYWEGGRQTDPDRRPFALHRNCYAGIQRWGWLWSGDTFSTWKTLQTQIMMGINAGLNGVPYWGTDIGGFVPTAEFTAELFVRWFQFGAFCPSFRCHGRAWQLRRPWGWNTGSFGPSEMGKEADAFLPKPEDLHNAAVEEICRRYLNLRYQLLPYLYTAAWQTHTTGLPLIRSLGLSFPEDKQAWETEDAFSFGDSLLVAPVFQQGAKSRQVYLPKAGWFDFWTGTLLQGGQTVSVATDLATMPLFVRAGTILHLGPLKQYTSEPSNEPDQLVVYPGADGRCLLYNDDGESFGYERGEYALMECTWTERERRLRLTLNKPGPWLPQRFLLKVAGGTFRPVELHGESQTYEL